MDCGQLEFGCKERGREGKETETETFIKTYHGLI